MQNTINADLVIADLTETNPNVFYELGVRHATGKPTVQLVQDGEPMPFDVSVIRAIKYTLSDPDLLEAATEELKKQVEGFEQNPRTETPVSQAMNLQNLQQSKSPLETGIADIAVALEGMSRDIQELRQQSVLQGLNHAIDQPKIGTFSGVGPGTYRHGLGQTPDVVLLQAIGPVFISYDSVGPTSVHVVTSEGTPFVGAVIKSMSRDQLLLALLRYQNPTATDRTIRNRFVHLLRLLDNT